MTNTCKMAFLKHVHNISPMAWSVPPSPSHSAITSSLDVRVLNLFISCCRWLSLSLPSFSFSWSVLAQALDSWTSTTRKKQNATSRYFFSVLTCGVDKGFIFIYSSWNYVQVADPNLRTLQKFIYCRFSWKLRKNLTELPTWMFRSLFVMTD